MQIYVITAFQKITPSTIHNFADLGDRRCVGFYNDENEAKNAVENNFNNIHDNIYEYVIIEEMHPGIKLPDTKRQLFHWDGASYCQISVPELLNHMSNFGIG